jgi:hypothetical protein
LTRGPVAQNTLQILRKSSVSNIHTGKSNAEWTTRERAGLVVGRTFRPKVGCFTLDVASSHEYSTWNHSLKFNISDFFKHFVFWNFCGADLANWALFRRRSSLGSHTKSKSISWACGYHRPMAYW